MAKKASPRTSADEKKHIAVVEEVADNIYSIKFILQSLGYQVKSIAAQADFLEALMAFAPELIIVDMMIPDGAGFTVIRRIHESSLSKTPLLAITAGAMQGEEDDVYEAGARDTLSKPYTVTELQKKLGKWLKS
ncbi:MAG: response regulator [Acidobacteriota bacterium]